MKFAYVVLVLLIGLASVQCMKFDSTGFLQDESTGETSGEETTGETSGEGTTGETSEEGTTEEAYDGNMYELEDPTFYEEVTLEILADVESGAVTSGQAIAQLAVMYEDEWMTEVEYEWAYEEAERLGEQAGTS